MAEEQKKTPQTDGESTEPAVETSPGHDPAAAATDQKQDDPTTETVDGSEAASTDDTERTPEPAPPAGEPPDPEPVETIAEPATEIDTEPAQAPAAEAEPVVTEPSPASPDPRPVTETESASLTGEPATPAAETTVSETGDEPVDTAEAPVDEPAQSAQATTESSIVGDTSEPDADPGPTPPPDETGVVVESPASETVSVSAEEPAAGALVEAEAPVAVAEAQDDASVALPDPLAPYGLTVPDDGPVLPAERTLEMFGGESVVLPVAYINRAEAFYHDLFEMDIVLRAWHRGHRWEMVAGEFAWEPAMIHGEFPALSFLQRDDWSLVLESAGRGMVFRSAVAHEALVPVSIETLRRLRARVLIAGYTLLRDQADEFAFRDPFRVVWRITAIEPPN